MAEIYAKSASIKDARVQSLAYKPDASISESALSERESGYKKGEEPFKEIPKVSYETLQAEYSAIKGDASRPADVRAAAEILEAIALKAVARLNQKTKFSSSLVHFLSALSIRLFPKDSKIEDKIDKTTVILNTVSTNIANKYSRTITFSDRLRTASAGAEKELGAPFEKATKYADIL
tara:strand:- start:2293 stop:2826 length:534 start_codon:yes stop_codon:yes gene_type:complete